MNNRAFRILGMKVFPCMMPQTVGVTFAHTVYVVESFNVKDCKLVLYMALIVIIK